MPTHRPSSRRSPPRKRAGVASGARRFSGEVLDVAGVAALLGTSQKAIRARAGRGLLPYRRWAGRVVFLRTEILTFLAQLEGCTVGEALANTAARKTAT